MTKIVIHQDDRLLLYGYGLFETLKVRPEGIEVPARHWQRMVRGGKLLEIEVPSFEEWLSLIREHLVQDSRQGSAPPYALRVTLSGGASSQGQTSQILLHTRRIPYSADEYRRGIEAAYISQPRNPASILTRIKSTNCLENILARQELERRGAREGIWLNTSGHLAEGTVSNIFFIKGETLFTPSLECGCLAGTRRQLIIEIASSLGIEVLEGKFLPSALLVADKVFMTNSLMGIMPVAQIERTRYSSLQAGIVETLQSNLEKTLQRSLEE